MTTQLKLLKLALNNFGKHQNLEIDFSSTLTVIRGPNGAGKSTVLQAVYFALFGVSAIDGKSSDITHDGSDDLSVTLTVNINDKQYEIFRTLKNAEVKFSGELIASKTSVVNEWVQKEIGVTKQAFMALSYSPQSETSSILTTGAAELNRMVENLAGAYFVGLVAEKSSYLADSTKYALAQIPEPKASREELESIINEAQDRIKLLAAQLECKKQEQSKISAEIDSNTKTLQEITSKNEKREELIKAQAALTSSIDDHNDSKDNVVYELSKLDAIDDEVVSRLRIEHQIADMNYSEAVSKHNRLKECSRRRTSLLEEKEKAHKNWVLYTSNIHEKEKAEYALSEAKTNSAQIEHSLEIANRDLMAANKAVENAICPACKRPFAADGLAEMTKHRDELRNEYDRIKAIANMRAEQVKNAETAYEKISRLVPPESATVFDQAQELNKLEREIAEYSEITDDKLDALTKDKADRLDDFIAANLKNNKKTDYTSELHELTDKLDELSDRLNKVNLNLIELGEQEDSSKLLERNASLLLLYGECRHEYSELSKSLADEKTICAVNQEILQNTTKALEDRKLLSLRANNFTALSKFLRTNRADFISSLWDQLMLVTSEFISQVTEGQISQIERKDGQFWYTEGEQTRSCARLSGGFRSIAGVGLRLALASLLPAGVSICLLDEPSAELAEDLALALAAALRTQERQIVMVTHRHGEMFSADSVIELS